MKSIYKIVFTAAAISLLTFTGCKKFRDINDNPNNPEQVTIQLILPAAQANIAQALGGKFQIIGGLWSQYWTQNPSSSQYRVFEQYQISGSDINNAWNGLYAGALMDLQKVIDSAGSQKNYSAIAKILQGYTFHLLTDQFGDIPFSEALKGESQDITSPKYESQEAVYNGIIALVKEGMAEINEGAHPASDDLIYHGDMALWQKFGNTLLLKVYMRLSERSPSVAQQGIAELYANGLGFIEEGETALMTYSSEAGNYNPLYSEMDNSVIGRIQNLVASATAVDSFNSNGDIRVAIFYAPGGGGYVGLKQGDYGSSTPGTSVARPSAAVGGDASDLQSAVAPVVFISDYESLLLQAEAVVRGWATGDDKTLYERAISANFEAYASTFATLQQEGVLPTLVVDSVATSDTTGNPFFINYSIEYVVSVYLSGDSALINAGDYYLGGEPVVSTPSSFWGKYPVAGSATQKLEFIITQKWFCMCGNQNIESWTEWRRTGFPSFFVYSPNSRIGNNFPVRFPYPDDEVSNNLNFPGQKQVTDKVWWDVN